jgi:SAM-dependent methyltransferase
LLDVGCGNLDNLRALRPLYQWGFGIDIASYPEWARSDAGIQARIHDLDSGPLPFEDGHFDAVTILMVLEHVFDPFFVVEELSRVTRTGGHLVINVPNIAFVRHRLTLLGGGLPVTSSRDTWERREWDGGHIHNFTLARLEWLLEKFGHYRIIKRTASGRLALLKDRWPSVFGADLQLLCSKLP